MFDVKSSSGICCDYAVSEFVIKREIDEREREIEAPCQHQSTMRDWSQTCTHTKGKPLEHVTQGIKAKEIKAGAASKGMPWQQGLC